MSSIRGSRSQRSLLSLVAMAAAGMMLLSGCGTFERITEMSRPVESQVYATAESFANEASAIVVPEWLPEDAVNIRIKASRSGKGAIMMFEAESFAPKGCDVEGESKLPRLRDSWWPEILPEQRLGCGNWHAAVDAARVYAWTRSDVRRAAG